MKMNNLYINAKSDLDFYPYYRAQAGAGIANGHVGDRYHIGNGMWGTVLSYLPKALKYISKFGLGGLKSFSNDVMEGKPVGEAGVNALTTTAQSVIRDANDKLEKFKAMRGRGRPVGSKNKPKAQAMPKAKAGTKKKKTKKVYKGRSTRSYYI